MTSLRIALALLALAPLAAPVAAEIRFREVAAAWGAGFTHRHGAGGELYMIETMGAGVAAFDYDGDGDPDLLWVDSGPLPLDPAARPRHRLLRNDAGRFVDVTEAAGIAGPGYGMGATAGDVDGDGDLDLYLTNFGANLLFVNQGDGTFREEGARRGVADPSWSASATFFDAERDGDLDLYVTNYVDFTFEKNPPCGRPEEGLRSYCHPDVYRGLPDRFFRNRGDGTFEDATTAAGFGGADGNGLGVVAADLDRDGWTDLYVANDMTPNFLFRNRGDGTFEDLGLLSGTAMSDLGKPEAGMGIALADLDGNGFLDLVVTHLDLQTNAVYRNQGGFLFLDGRYASRLAEPSLYKVGFGTAAADLDGDGDDDLVVANGHIIHNVEAFGTGTTYKQANQVFENTGGVFAEVTGAGLDLVRSSRGLALADFDGDGDLDVAVNNSADDAELWTNETAPAGGWLQIDVAGGAGGVGVGTMVTLSVPVPQTRQVITASSYLAQSATTLQFGLAGHRTAADLTVDRPNEPRQRLTRLPAGRRVRLVSR